MLVLLIILISQVFNIHDFQMMIISSIDDIWTQVQSAEWILIRLHEDEFVSFNHDIEFVGVAFFNFAGILLSQKDQRLDCMEDNL